MHRLETFPTPELCQKYRNVFSSKEAPEVLYHILFELGAFIETPDMTAEDMALKSYGIRLLTILGGGQIGSEAVKQFIKRLISQPIEEKTKEA